MRKLFYFGLFLLLALASCSHSDRQLYKVERDGRFGFIDAKGREVIEPQYLLAGDFHNGLAYVVTDTTSGHFEEDYELLFLRKEVDSVYVTYGYIDSRNHFAIKPEKRIKLIKLWGMARGMKNDSWPEEDEPFSLAYINSVLDKYINFTPDGLAVYQAAPSDTLFGDYGQLGYINKKGDIVIEAKFPDANPFSEGKAVVQMRTEQYFDDGTPYYLDIYWGCINTRGETIVDPIYLDFNSFKGGRALAWQLDHDQDIDLIAYFDEDGRIVNETDSWALLYDYGEYTESGIACVNQNGRSEERFGDFFIDNIGNRIKPGRGLSESQLEQEKSKPHRLELYWGDAFDDCRPFSEGFAPVRINEDEWTYVDTNLIICGKDFDSWSFEDAQPFSNGLAAVKRYGKYGYINTDFELVIPYRYETAEPFQGELARVTEAATGSHYYDLYINKKGETVWGVIK